MLDLVKRAEKLLQDEFDDTQAEEYLEGEGFAPCMISLAMTERKNKREEDALKQANLTLKIQECKNDLFRRGLLNGADRFAPIRPFTGTTPTISKGI